VHVGMCVSCVCALSRKSRGFSSGHIIICTCGGGQSCVCERERQRERQTEEERDGGERGSELFVCVCVAYVCGWV
jgi:hypothetical protein